MGDMADDALDQIMDIDELYMQHHMDPLAEQYEMGLVDELGFPLTKPLFSSQSRFTTAVGPGACPRCGAPTEQREGIHGTFFGCTRYPACRGSRNYG